MNTHTRVCTYTLSLSRARALIVSYDPTSAVFPQGVWFGHLPDVHAEYAHPLSSQDPLRLCPVCPYPAGPRGGEGSHIANPRGGNTDHLCDPTKVIENIDIRHIFGHISGVSSSRGTC